MLRLEPSAIFSVLHLLILFIDLSLVIFLSAILCRCHHYCYFFFYFFFVISLSLSLLCSFIMMVVGIFVAALLLLIEPQWRLDVGR